MQYKEYNIIKKTVGDEDISKYNILRYIEENIITDEYTFKNHFDKLEEIAEKEETVKMYNFIMKLYYDNDPFIFTNDYRDLKFEFKRHVINSTGIMMILDV